MLKQYEIEQIPLGTKPKLIVKARDIEDLKNRLQGVIDTKKRYRTYEDGELLKKPIFSYRSYKTFLNESGEIKTVHKDSETSGLHKNYFKTKEESKEHFRQAYQKVQPRLLNAKQSVLALQAVGNFDIDYFMKGDTHGIHDAGMNISVEEDGYTFYIDLD